MKAWDEHDRYKYTLPLGSLVMDIGAHHGEFAGIFAAEKQPCTIISYEPIKEFHRIALENLAKYPNVISKNYGLGAKTELRTFRVKGDMTGPWADSGPTEIVEIVGIGDELKRLGTGTVALAKINIEGGEYDLLEAILDQDLARRFRNLQIQFHEIADINPVERWKSIRNRLAETHRLEYADPSMEFKSNCWEGWTIR
jgi:FkbM family methyltransferase